MKVHVDKNGQPQKCRAIFRCPLGGEHRSFDSLEEAKPWAERVNAEQILEKRQKAELREASLVVSDRSRWDEVASLTPELEKTLAEKYPITDAMLAKAAERQYPADYLSKRLGLKQGAIFMADSDMHGPIVKHEGQFFELASPNPEGSVIPRSAADIRGMIGEVNESYKLTTEFFGAEMKGSFYGDTEAIVKRARFGYEGWRHAAKTQGPKLADESLKRTWEEKYPDAKVSLFHSGGNEKAVPAVLVEKDQDVLIVTPNGSGSRRRVATLKSLKSADLAMRDTYGVSGYEHEMRDYLSDSL